MNPIENNCKHNLRVQRLMTKYGFDSGSKSLDIGLLYSKSRAV